MKYISKIVILGDPTVGKTSIRKRYMGDSFFSNYLPTLGADFSVVKQEFGDVEIEFQIWDIAGQHSFDSLTPRFIRNSNALILVFDLTSQKTFMNLPLWIKKYYEENKNTFKEAPIIIVGNKSDLSDQMVTKQHIEDYATKLRKEFNLKDGSVIPYLTSAKTGENIDNLFTLLFSYTQGFVDQRN